MIKLDIHLKNDFDSKYIGVEITKEDILQLACDKAKGRYMESYWHTITADEDTMTINLKGYVMWKLYIIAITLHFIFDWVLQTRTVAKSKKKDISCLATHMLLNILPFSFILGFVMIWFNYDPAIIIGICTLNFICHFLIDLLLPAGRTEREMINWTAIDQILHINILILLLQL